jgi:translation initiation factor IF-2
VEAINHAKEAGVPVVVALNKMDKEGANPDKVKGELAAQGLQPEDWGGTVPVVPCSAKTNMGINDLLDHIVLLAEVADLKANPNRSAVATVIESHLDPSLGALASVIINTGTLHVGEPFLCGATAGKVRSMEDARGQRLDAVGPSGAARVSGFGTVPEVGDIVQVVHSEQQARTLSERMQKLGVERRKRSFADLVGRLSEGKLKTLKIVLKADTQGTLEAVRDALGKLTTEQVGAKIIHSAVGNVSESDVMMAAASDGMVIAFHTDVPPGVLPTADREGVEVRRYDVVYALLEEIDGLLKGLVEPEEEEAIVGHLQIRGVFLTRRNEQIVGGAVTDGSIKRLPFRLIRSGEPVGEGRITSVKHVEKDVKEAKAGSECGVRVETSQAIAEGDVLEVYVRELKKKR